MNKNSFDIKRICTNLRPAKAVTLFFKDENWHEKCLKIIEIYSQVWGGKQNLIIPTDGEKIDKEFWIILEKFDPDYFFIYYGNNENKDISSKLKREILKRLNPFYSKNEDIDDNPIEYPFFADQNDFFPLTYLPDIIPGANLSSEYEQIRFSYDEFDPDIDFQDLNPDNDIIGLDTDPDDVYYGSSTSPYFENEVDFMYNPIINSNNIIRLMGHSILGKTNIFYLHKLGSLGIDVKDKEFNNENLDGLLFQIWKNNSKYPFRLSMINLGWYDDKESVIKTKPSVIVVTGDKLEDFCLYYNLSRMRYDVLWAPICMIEASLEQIKRKECDMNLSEFKLSFFIEILFRTLYERMNYGFSSKRIVFTSLSKSKAQLNELINNFSDLKFEKPLNSVNQFFTVSNDIEEFLYHIFRVFEQENRYNCYMEQFVGGKSINPLNTPLPIKFNINKVVNHYWITEVNIERYKLPQKSILNDLTVENRDQNFFMFGGLEIAHRVRISKNGLAYFSPAPIKVIWNYTNMKKDIIRPGIKLIEPFEIFRKIFEEIDYYILTSDKGNYERESIEKFSSLETIAKYLMNEKYQNFFSNFVKKQNPASPDDGIFLKDDFRMYMNLKAIEKILGDEVKIIINDFIEKEILHRGFIFKCEKCKYTGWYDIEDVDIKFKCRRCRKIQYYNFKHLARQNPVEPEWFYKLDETIYQGYDNDMIVPILTLHKLKELSKESFLYTNEIEIRKKENPEDQYREIDICCISDGKIMIGECKRHNKLKDKEIQKYKDIYEEIGANKIIFSTFDKKGWSKGTLKKLKEILGEKINYEIFNKEDLCL